MKEIIFFPFPVPRSLKSPPLFITHQTKTILHTSKNQTQIIWRMDGTCQQLDKIVHLASFLQLLYLFHHLYFNEVFIDYDIHIRKLYKRHYLITSAELGWKVSTLNQKYRVRDPLLEHGIKWHARARFPKAKGTQINSRIGTIRTFTQG